MGINSIFDFPIKLFLLFHSILGWKTHKSAIAESQRIYYKFVKPHKALDGKTPAEKVGLNLEKNQWLNLIRKSLIS
jgi:hypothetical protein